MRRWTACLGWCLSVAAILAAQDKSPTPVGKIFTCMQASNCPNTKKSAVTWYDVVGISVVEFVENGQTYSLASGREQSISIWITLQKESRPSRLITIGTDGKVISAELSTPTPGRVAPHRLTREQSAQWRLDMRALSPLTGGEEFRTFWQDQADGALAAIARVMAR